MEVTPFELMIGAAFCKMRAAWARRILKAAALVVVR
jgi:hypothetical protein